MEKPRGFSWSLVSMVMLEGWGWLNLMGCPRDTSPKTSAVCFLPETLGPTPPPTACIVLAFRVASSLALCPHPVQAHWAGFFVTIKKDGVPSCLERDRGGQGPPLTLIPQPLSISTLDSKVTTRNLRVGSVLTRRPWRGPRSDLPQGDLSSVYVCRLLRPRLARHVHTHIPPPPSLHPPTHPMLPELQTPTPPYPLCVHR